MKSDEKKGERAAISQHFGYSTIDILEEEFKNRTIGLTTKEDFVRKKEHLQQMIQGQLFRKGDRKSCSTRQVFQKTKIHLEEDELDEIEQPCQRKMRGLGRDPGVATDFLPDQHSVEQSVRLQNQIKKEYIRQSEKIKQQIFELRFSYWDGPRNVFVLRAKKRERVLTVLQNCRIQLFSIYPAMGRISAQDLIITVKDTILPHNLTFYEIQANLIKTKHGKPLFDWQQKLAIRDGKEESIFIAEGKPCVLVQQSRFQKLKLVYPCSEWQTVDMNKLNL